jgi:hypothetical protein
MNLKPVTIASLILMAGAQAGADNLKSSQSFPQCTNIGFPSIFAPGSELEYDVLRKGKKIGKHKIEFEQTPAGLLVTADTRMKVSILFVTVFRYRYQSEELWCDGQLLNVKTTVNDNGDKLKTNAIKVGDKYIVHNKEGEFEIDQNFFTTNHWNPGVIETNHLFNTITGEVKGAKYSQAGQPVLETKNGSKQVTQYTVDGEFNIDTFYDTSGVWSGMQFKHPDGSEIEFRCVKCDLIKETAS